MIALQDQKQSQDIWQEEMKQRRKIKRLVRVIAVVAAVVALVLSAALLWQLQRLKLTMTVDAPEEITVEYGEEFAAPEAQAVFGGWIFGLWDREVDVAVSGSVNTDVLGTYQLGYSSEYALNYWVGSDTYRESRILTVRVVDTQAPVIDLVTKENAFTVPGQEYEEEGFSAEDNVDGDVTSLVQREIREDTVIYRVTDSSGNTAQAQRKIRYDDPVPPVLTLQGDVELTVNQWLTYVDPGYTALDNCDGDITDRVVVTGSVDMQVPGAYTLTYTVTDSYNNTASVQRNVYVRERSWTPALPMGTFEEPATPEEKTIYLTFDDGPSMFTPKLLEILEKYDVKATFFVIHSKYISYVKDIAEAGHTVAMHANSHSYNWIYSSDNAYFNDLYTIQNLIYEYTGQRPTMLRFPGGTSNTVSRKYSKGIMSRLTARLREMGYRYFDWNVDSHDASDGKSTQAVYNNVIKGITGKKVAVVLQHDIFEFSIDAVEDIILWGLENGYTFKALDTSSPMCIHGLNN